MTMSLHLGSEVLHDIKSMSEDPEKSLVRIRE